MIYSYQFAMHVIDYYCACALARHRALGRRDWIETGLRFARNWTRP